MVFLYFFRTWRSNIDNGKCVIVTTSIAHAESETLNSVPATVLASRYLIEPAEYGRSRVTHVYRVDLRLAIFIITNSWGDITYNADQIDNTHAPTFWKNFCTIPSDN